MAQAQNLNLIQIFTVMSDGTDAADAAEAAKNLQDQANAWLVQNNSVTIVSISPATVCNKLFLLTIRYCPPKDEAQTPFSALLAQRG